MSPITITQNVAEAAAYLASGRLVAFPTGTSYGLAADALQGWALQRLRNIKARPSEKTFTVFMREELYGQFLRLTKEETALLTKMANQPLTLLVQPTWELDHLAQDGHVGLRVIDHPLMNELAAAVDVPLTATSANRSGQPSCFSPSEIQQAFANPLPTDRLGEDNPRGAAGTTYDLSLVAILDGGTLPQVQPTTIAKLEGDKITIIRPGALTAEDLTKKHI